MRTTHTCALADPVQFKQNLLLWSQQYYEIVWLDSNNYKDKYGKYDAVLAVDAFTSLKTDYFNAFNDLQEYQSRVNDWIFGYLTYDLKIAWRT